MEKKTETKENALASLASPRPWTEETVVVAPAFKPHTTSLPFRPLCEENWQLAKYCVNSHPSLVSLVKEMGEALEDAISAIKDEVLDQTDVHERKKRWESYTSYHSYIRKIQATLTKYKQSQI